MNLIIKETVLFDHKGVKITIELDYESGQVSFVERDGKAKNYKFAKRTRNYLGGWYLILEGLQEAAKFADSKLAEQAEIREKIKDKKMLDIAISLMDLDKDKKVKS